jgi:hypothetical protein
MDKKEIDRLITESLSREEAEFYDSLEEEKMAQQIRGLYGGRMKWIAIAGAIVHTAAVFISVYCLYQIFTVTDTAVIMRNMTVLFVSWSFGIMIKLWQWMQMDKEAVIREMKRLEFQVAILLEERRDK